MFIELTQVDKTNTPVHKVMVRVDGILFVHTLGAISLVAFDHGNVKVKESYNEIQDMLKYLGVYKRLVKAS